MQFDTVWNEMWEYMNLPEDAKVQIPMCLSETTKKAIVNRRDSSTEIATLIEEAVDLINHGSVKSVDSLVYDSIAKIGWR